MPSTIIQKHNVFHVGDISFHMSRFNWESYCVAWTVLNHSDVQSLDSVGRLYNTALEKGIVFQ